MNQSEKKPCVVLGVTGGIAAYKACDLVSRLVKRGAQVRVVLTEHATRFVPPMTFEALSGNPAHVDSFAPRSQMAHISLAKWADAFVIAPATANCMAKLCRYEEAILAYKKAMPMRPKPRFCDCEQAVAHIYEIQGNYRAAIEMNRQALQLIREDWTTEGETVDFFLREISRLEELVR